MLWKLKFKWVFACVKEGVKACQDAFGHLSPEINGREGIIDGSRVNLSLNDE